MNHRGYPTVKERGRIRLTGLSEATVKGELSVVDKAVQDLQRMHEERQSKRSPVSKRRVAASQDLRDAGRDNIRHARRMQGLARVAIKQGFAQFFGNEELATDLMERLRVYVGGDRYYPEWDPFGTGKSPFTGKNWTVKGQYTIPGFHRIGGDCGIWAADWMDQANTGGCLVLQAGGSDIRTYVIQSWMNGVHSARWGGTRWKTVEQWVRDVGFTGATAIKLRAPLFADFGAPPVNQSLDPMSQPIASRAKRAATAAQNPVDVPMWLGFRGTPAPLPYAVLPGLVNTWNRQAGHDVLPEWAALKPYQVPATQTSVVLGPPGSPPGAPVTTGHPHERRPPNRNERERKTRVGGKFGRALATIASSVTEATDVIDAVFEALPQDLQRKLWIESGGFLTPHEKAWLAFNHHDQLDPGKVVINLALEQVQDAVIARGSKLARENNPLGGGSQAGLGWLRQVLSDHI